MKLKFVTYSNFYLTETMIKSPRNFRKLKTNWNKFLGHSEILSNNFRQVNLEIITLIILFQTLMSRKGFYFIANVLKIINI